MDSTGTRYRMHRRAYDLRNLRSRRQRFTLDDAADLLDAAAAVMRKYEVQIEGLSGLVSDMRPHLTAEGSELHDRLERHRAWVAAGYDDSRAWSIYESAQFKQPY
jgi:hypothetical protein